MEATEQILSTYDVSLQTDSSDPMQVTGRDSAVQTAKELSRDKGPVEVKRSDGRVRMRFIDGQLVSLFHDLSRAS